MRRIGLFVALLTLGAAVSASAQNVATYRQSASGTDVQLVDPTHPLPVTATATVTGVSTATNQTNVQANAGSDATKAIAVQGITGGEAIAVQSTTPTMTKIAYTMDGSSDTVVSSNGALHYLILYNPTSNGNVTVDLSGGTVSANAGIVLTPGGSITLEKGLTNAVTVIGTNTQILYGVRG